MGETLRLPPKKGKQILHEENNLRELNLYSSTKSLLLHKTNVAFKSELFVNSSNLQVLAD
jgi:hypothetical protein